MKEIVKTVLNYSVLWLWQLPQHLLGAILILVTRAKKVTCSKSNIVYWKFERNNRFTKYISGVSLGIYILLADNDGEETVRHEWGHSKQSLSWGLLYLFVIGIPSASGNLIGRRKRKQGMKSSEIIEWYYNLPWEWDADERGKVNRPWKTRR